MSKLVEGIKDRMVAAAREAAPATAGAASPGAATQRALFPAARFGHINNA